MSEQSNGAAVNGNGQHKANEGRTAGGRFAVGNKGGPGNPYARQTASIRKAAADSATPLDAAEVMAALLTKAKGGDVASARLWFQLAGGRIGPGADPDMLDAHELEVRRRNTASAEDMRALVERFPAAVMAELASAATPGIHAHTREALMDGVKARVAAKDKAATDTAEGSELAAGSHRDPALPWLREGMPDGVRELFELFPAYIHPHDRPAATTAAYGAMIRRVGGDILERLGDRADADEGRWVPRAVKKRAKR